MCNPIYEQFWRSQTMISLPSDPTEVINELATAVYCSFYHEAIHGAGVREGSHDLCIHEVHI